MIGYVIIGVVALIIIIGIGADICSGGRNRNSKSGGGSNGGFLDFIDDIDLDIFND